MQKSVFIIAAAALACWAAPENYSNWGYDRDVSVSTVGATTTDLDDFPLLVRLTSAESQMFTLAKAGGADLRFAAADGKHLPYHIEYWNAGTSNAAIWVSVPLKANAVNTFRMYWGNSAAVDSGRPAAVFDKAKGYQGVWHCDADLGDATGGSAAGENHGSKDAEGAVGRARNFNGTSDYVRLGNAPHLNFAGVIALEAWVRWLDGGLSGTLMRRHIITHGNGAAGKKTETVLRMLKENYFAGSYDGVTKTEVAATSPIAGDSATWIHLAGVYDGANWRLYRNGVQVAIKAGAQGALTSDTGWFIGTWAPDARYFSGDIDEVRVSSTLRGADWIKFGYLSQKQGQTAVTYGGIRIHETAVRTPPTFGRAGAPRRAASDVAGRAVSKPASRVWRVLTYKP